MIAESRLSADIEERIQSLSAEYAEDRRPHSLYEPFCYTMDSGGKRLRPLLCLAVAQALSTAAGRNWLVEDTIDIAAAVEVFHNFTLVHDDVMDRSDLRRGRPTVFAKWGSTQAILTGDAMLTIATKLVSEYHHEKFTPKLLRCFNETALRVYEGQQLDIDFETAGNAVSVDDYIEMIRLKTSELLSCACVMGAITAGADDAVCQAFRRYAINLGLAFQLRDDYLDTFGDPKIFGKPIGGDIRNRKHTWLFITALQEAPTQMEMAEKLRIPAEDIYVKTVTEIYTSLSLDKRCQQLVESHCAQAIDAIKEIGLTEDDFNWFAQLANKLCSRQK